MSKRYKKLIKELFYVYSELEYINEALPEAHSEFERYYQDYCKKNDIPIDELNKKNAKKIRISSIIRTSLFVVDVSNVIYLEAFVKSRTVIF